VSLRGEAVVGEARNLKALDGSVCENIDAFATELGKVMQVALRKAVLDTARDGQFLASSDWDALIMPELG
jgi:hypothetical protein